MNIPYNAAGTPAAARKTTVPKRRWMIGLLLGAGVLVNYIDRINLSVAAPDIQHEFGLSATQLGLLFSAYGWTYALLQIPTGLFLDRYGVTRIGRLSAFLWFIASGLTGLAGGMGGLVLARLILGVAEAPTFPANAKATGYWFPRSERALATSLFDAAAKFSNVIGVPLVAFAVVQLGWRGGFAVTAVLSLIYFAVYWALYRDPGADPRLDPTELAHIRAGGAAEEGASAANPGRLLRHLLASRKVWGLTLGFSAYGYTFYLFLTWLPAYLVQTMHMDGKPPMSGPTRK